MRHNPRCAIYRDPPSLRSAEDCNCGAVPRLPKAQSKVPDGTPGRPADDPMIGMLRAYPKVRDGMWIKGAPTHVLAEFLTQLEEDGWELRRRPADPEVFVIEGWRCTDCGVVSKEAGGACGHVEFAPLVGMSPR